MYGHVWAGETMLLFAIIHVIIHLKLFEMYDTFRGKLYNTGLDLSPPPHSPWLPSSVYTWRADSPSQWATYCNNWFDATHIHKNLCSVAKEQLWDRMSFIMFQQSWTFLRRKIKSSYFVLAWRRMKEIKPQSCIHSSLLTFCHQISCSYQHSGVGWCLASGFHVLSIGLRIIHFCCDCCMDSLIFIWRSEKGPPTLTHKA